MTDPKRNETPADAPTPKPRALPLGEEKHRDEPPAPEAPDKHVSIGDMQEVGATAPEEVPERRDEVDGETPVHENPGDQNSG